MTLSTRVAAISVNIPHVVDSEAEATPERSVGLHALDSLERCVSPLRLLSALAMVGALWWGQVVLIPLVLSILISYALEPLVARLESHRVPRSVAVPILLVALLSIASGGVYALRGEAVAFVDRLPAAVHTVAQAIRNATHGTPGAMTRVQDAARELETAASTATKESAQDGVTAVRIEEPTFKWSDWGRAGLAGAVEFAAQTFAVLCLVYYLLVAGDLYKRKLVRMVPTLSDKKLTVQIFTEINRQIERFLLARLAISVIVGIVVWLAFRLLGLQEAGVWGVLSAALFAIPIAGPTVIVLGAAVAGFVQFGSWSLAAAAAGVCLVIGALEGNVLTPWLMSRVGEMNAVAVFVSLLFWGWIWGIWGLLLAVPITAAVKAVCERVPEFQSLAELLKE